VIGVAVVAVLGLLHFSAGTYVQAGRVLAKVKTMAENPIQYLETTWTSAGPLTQLVRTERNPDETEEDFAARHKASVDALKALYPPT
jgi:hypothetical protein